MPRKLHIVPNICHCPENEWERKKKQNEAKSEKLIRLCEIEYLNERKQKQWEIEHQITWTCFVCALNIPILNILLPLIVVENIYRSSFCSRTYGNSIYIFICTICAVRKIYRLQKPYAIMKTNVKKMLFWFFQIPITNITKIPRNMRQILSSLLRKDNSINCLAAFVSPQCEDKNCIVMYIVQSAQCTVHSICHSNVLFWSKLLIET